MLGCQNTPAKGCRYCPLHKQSARKFIDDNISDGDNAGKSDEGDLLIVKVLNEKSTRQGRMFEVINNYKIFLLSVRHSKAIQRCKINKRKKK